MKLTKADENTLYYVIKEEKGKFRVVQLRNEPLFHEGRKLLQEHGQNALTVLTNKLRGDMYPDLNFPEVDLANYILSPVEIDMPIYYAVGLMFNSQKDLDSFIQNAEMGVYDQYLTRWFTRRGLLTPTSNAAFDVKKITQKPEYREIDIDYIIHWAEAILEGEEDQIYPEGTISMLIEEETNKAILNPIILK